MSLTCFYIEGHNALTRCTFRQRWPGIGVGAEDECWTHILKAPGSNPRAPNINYFILFSLHCRPFLGPFFGHVGDDGFSSNCAFNAFPLVFTAMVF